MTDIKDNIPEIIRLQLRKPMNWEWKLSTFKPSQKISLPIIQLYNYNGQLLIEAKDNESTTAQNKELAVNDKKKSQVLRAGKLNKSRSDALQCNVNVPRNKFESINRNNTNRQSNSNGKYFNNQKFNPVNSTWGISRIGQRNEETETQTTDSDIKSYTTGNSCNCVRKYKSNASPDKANPFSLPAVYKRNSFSTFPEFISPHKRRSKSDEFSRCKFTSSKESIKRAELDGYVNFITPNISCKSLEKLNRNKKTLRITESKNNAVCDNSTFDIAINDCTPKTYRTRTSSAGTLIISEENDVYHRRRHCNYYVDKTSMEEKKYDIQGTVKNSNNSCAMLEEEKRIRQISYSADSVSENTFNSLTSNTLVESEGNPSASPRNTGPIIEKLNGDIQSKVCSQSSHKSTSSNTINENSSQTKGHLVKDPQSQNRGVSVKIDLLQLVDCLPSNNNVKMGANVSRHSAKGLSGRRSQSSGSICNGKGRHPDGKICGSLPSYLDDRQSNGCNNNHYDCEKQPLGEEDRIPPLGDGAPLHWKFSDTQTALCDQGYGSERSPEEEYPPPLPDHDHQCHHHLEPHACYPFITPESTFIVKLTKGTRGLGLSVTGGIDSNGSWPGLIRIKRLFPHQPASACGLLNIGDLLLQANGIALTGLTNYEALEVLRTAHNQVDLKVCRPPPDVLNCVSPVSEIPPPPPRREPPCTLNLSSAIYSTPEDDYYQGEFEVTLKKIHGSLGFTLRKVDDSALGHYVRALVREPALTDGRIKAGDKIISVNNVQISPMSHEQAVQFLRQCPEVVKLRLYRDSAQTPVAALSPSETTPRTSFSRKAHLRQEAVDMLNDIAVRKLIPGNQDICRRSFSPSTSPQRMRRQNCTSDTSQIADFSTTFLINDEQFHEGLLQKCSHSFDDDAFNSLFSIEAEDDDKPHRPSSLDLYNPNQTPVAARKPRFNFSLAHNAYELNNLDPEVLDAPNLTYNLGTDEVKSTDVEVGDSFPQEPASMPHIPLDNFKFSYKNPAYQSAHPQMGSDALNSSYTGNSNEKLNDTNTRNLKNSILQHEKKSDFDIDAHQIPLKEEYEVLAIELNRGWNSRLGFSLQGAAGVTYVSAVHADSVAAKDGRLKPGDRIIKVNDESVEPMTTNEIIDLLRILRGPVCVIVSRVKSTEDCSKSNAEE